MSEVKEGSSYGREISDKAMVEVNKAYESLHVSLVLWVGQSRTLATLTGSISTLFSKMTSLRYSICFQ